jgi:hypothetical protein
MRFRVLENVRQSTARGRSAKSKIWVDPTGDIEGRRRREDVAAGSELFAWVGNVGEECQKMDRIGKNRVMEVKSLTKEKKSVMMSRLTDERR